MKTAPFSDASGRPSSFLLPVFCLFLSGATSLTYEILWIKQFTLIFGGTLYAISAVLCAFMTGLALGAWILGRRLARGHPTRLSLIQLYGLLEGGIGIYGLAFPHLLAFTEAGYPRMVDLAGGSDSLLHFLEFLWATLLMLPSTSLMGATLPVVGSWAVGQKSDSLLSRVSLLYGINTLGAVGGVLVTQFLTVRHLGVLGTLWLTAGINGLICALCWLWGPRRESLPAPPSAHPMPAQAEGETVSPALALCLLGVFGYSGLVALSSEILWTRVLVFPLGSSIYSFALILAAFLLGIAVGSLSADRLLGGGGLVIKFLLLEAGIGLLGLLMIPLLDQITPLTAWLDRWFYDPENTALRTLALRSLLAFGLMFPPAFGFGLVFPLANQIHLDLFLKVPATLGGSYAVNTLGAILGTVLTPFVLIPAWGIERSLFWLFGGLLVLPAAVALQCSGWRGRRVLFPLALVLLAGAFFWLRPGIGTDRPGERNLSRLDFNVPPEHLKLRAYREGPFATLSVVENTQQDTRTLFVDGFSTATVSEGFGGTRYMAAMGLVPLLLHPDPRRALVMCFGTGTTVGTVALFPRVQVDAVEIDREVLSLAHWFERWNHRVTHRDTVRFIIQDARRHIRWTPNRYDVITLEPMHPAHAGVAHLYSREFYDQAAARLKPGGLMMQWLPLHLLNRDDSLAVMKTFQESFPYTSVWNSFLTRIVLLVGSKTPPAPDFQVFNRHLETPEVARAARNIGLHSFLDLMDFFITDLEPLRPLLDSSESITDDRPLLEHSPVTLLPPFPRETDETFLNLLLYRLDQSPPARGLPAGLQETAAREWRRRTAQRIAVFSRRYRGPGSEFFAERRLERGLQAVEAFWRKGKGGWVVLSDTGWAWSRQAGQAP